MRVNQSAGQQWRAPQWPRWLSAFHCWHRLTPAGALLSSPQSDKFPCAKRAFLRFFLLSRKAIQGLLKRGPPRNLLSRLPPSHRIARLSFTTPVLCCLVKCIQEWTHSMHRAEAISGKMLENICAFVSNMRWAPRDVRMSTKKLRVGSKLSLATNYSQLHLIDSDISLLADPFVLHSGRIPRII